MSQNFIYRHGLAVGFSVIIFGMLSVTVTFSVLGFLHDDIVDEKLVRYLEDNNKRFTNDESMPVQKRLEILKYDHKLTADDLGMIETIESSRISYALPYVISVVAIIAIGFFCIFLGSKDN